MKCPFCGHMEDRVVDSRSTREGEAVRRRRECLACTARFTTYEYVERSPVTVVKTDGRRVSYDRGKILGGLLRACEKRPVSREDLEALVDSVERKVVYSSLGGELTSKQLGEEVMLRLQDLDEVAYVRFASVYRRFTDLNQFTSELETLLDKREERKGK
ncbi:MAG: transcriptional repressor NrdR [bacterium]|nr:transcriptional repressor NrdR [bacterium]